MLDKLSVAFLIRLGILAVYYIDRWEKLINKG